ncbi:MAG: DNA-binding protein [Candidatus Riflebacteria bacterium HGW-Riflebacteria-1]|jgi:hypothetical protein|nr:MAG: DNA-binding protein [Candidatus Riflebacteria bacterium HGW-Riflebacteria-1]
MINFVFNHNHNLLPPASENTIPVQLYKLSGKIRNDVSFVGSPVLNKIKRLRGYVSPQAMDFLSIALAVTAADTFVQRSKSSDGWTREFRIKLPICDPVRWEPLKHKVEKALHFLSGDLWEFTFSPGGHPPPRPYRSRKERTEVIKLRNRDCVCLFSGGLDSAIGVIDLLSRGKSPLLVSHSYRGDKSFQEGIASSLPGQFSRLSASLSPRIALLKQGKTDITMRTRSLSFLALGALGISALNSVQQNGPIDFFVPENGFISLNTPLTPRRIGSLSTRTTHPFFISAIQEIFDEVGIPGIIKNPYQFDTKGEMGKKCLNQDLLKIIVDKTISCSHWKRNNEQCGACVPCLIRRAALHESNITELLNYSSNSLTDVLTQVDKRDDLLAMLIALNRKSSSNISSWITDAGPLPIEQLDDFKALFLRGLSEVKNYLQSEGIKCP